MLRTTRDCPANVTIVSAMITAKTLCPVTEITRMMSISAGKTSQMSTSRWRTLSNHPRK